MLKQAVTPRQKIDFVLVSRVPRLVPNGPKYSKNTSNFGPKWGQLHPKWDHADLWWALGRPCAPRYLKKSTFWTLSGPFGVPLGASWRHLDPLGGHFGDVCVSKIKFFYHVMSRPTFCIILGCFLEHFGSVLGGVRVPNRSRSGKVVIYANLGISHVKLRFAWVKERWEM